MKLNDKYVITFDDVCGTAANPLFKAKGFNTLVFDNNGLSKLTKLSDEIQKHCNMARREGFDAGVKYGKDLGYKQGLEAGKNMEFEHQFRLGYAKGHSIGYHLGKNGTPSDLYTHTFDDLNSMASFYEKGITEMWECVKKIVDLDAKYKTQVFGALNVSYILSKFTPDEALARIKAFEDSQKRCEDCPLDSKVPCPYENQSKCQFNKTDKDSSFNVGDEVLTDCYGKGVVTRVCNGTCSVTWFADGTNGVAGNNMIKKTGKHYADIAVLFGSNTTKKE